MRRFFGTNERNMGPFACLFRIFCPDDIYTCKIFVLGLAVCVYALFLQGVLDACADVYACNIRDFIGMSPCNLDSARIRACDISLVQPQKNTRMDNSRSNRKARFVARKIRLGRCFFDVYRTLLVGFCVAAFYSLFGTFVFCLSVDRARAVA